jgi:hypothetical protein
MVFTLASLLIRFIAGKASDRYRTVGKRADFCCLDRR